MSRKMKAEPVDEILDLSINSTPAPAPLMTVEPPEARLLSSEPTAPPPATIPTGSSLLEKLRKKHAADIEAVDADIAELLTEESVSLRSLEAAQKAVEDAQAVLDFVRSTRAGKQKQRLLMVDADPKPATVLPTPQKATPPLDRKPRRPKSSKIRPAYRGTDRAISRLSTEVLVEIFLIVLAWHKHQFLSNTPSSQIPNAVLPSVCRMWRHAATSSREFWSYIFIGRMGRTSSQKVEMIKQSIRQAKRKPLHLCVNPLTEASAGRIVNAIEQSEALVVFDSLSVYVHPDFKNNVLKWPSNCPVRQMTLRLTDESEVPTFLYHAVTSATSIVLHSNRPAWLTSVKPAISHLRHLCVRVSTPKPLHASEVAKCLKLFPTLARLEIDWDGPSLADGSLKPFVHGALRQLITHGDLVVAIRALSASITYSSLTKLHISLQSASPEKLASLWPRFVQILVNSPLHHLVLDHTSSISFDSTEFVRELCKFSGLKAIEFMGSAARELIPSFTAMSKEQLLPRWNRLVVKNADVDGDIVQALVSARYVKGLPQVSISPLREIVLIDCPVISAKQYQRLQKYARKGMKLVG